MQDVPGLRSYAQLRDGAVEVEGVLYAGYDELISMKSASGREEDLRDIAALEAARSERAFPLGERARWAGCSPSGSWNLDCSRYGRAFAPGG